MNIKLLFLITNTIKRWTIFIIHFTLTENILNTFAIVALTTNTSAYLAVAFLFNLLTSGFLIFKYRFSSFVS